MSRTDFAYEIVSIFDFSRLRAAVLAAGVAGLAVAGPALADSARLDGTWSGSGSLNYPSGAKEPARCNATFKKKTGTSYQVNARCASPSGKVEQTATLNDVGGNTYSGSFFNSEYNVDGTITVQVNGNMQNVSIVSPAGASAYFRMKR